MVLMNNFKEYRLRANLSQMQLAEKLHVSQACVSRWENTNSYPEVETGRKLSSLLHITLDELYDNEDKYGSFEIPVYQRMTSSGKTTNCTKAGSRLFLSYREMEMLYPRTHKEKENPEITRDLFFGFYYDGEEMKPVIRKDSVNVIFRSDKIFSGAIHLISLNDEDCHLARLTRFPHSVLVTTDIENGDSYDIKESKLNASALKIFGVVVQSRNSFLL